MKVFRKLDIIIIISLVVLSFTPNIIFAKTLKNYTSTYANIKMDGKIYDNVPLSSFKGEKELKLESNDGSNTIKVTNNKIKILHADCKDSLCIKQGEISKVGQTLVCLPNKLIIEIKGDVSTNSLDDEDIILSH